MALFAILVFGQTKGLFAEALLFSKAGAIAGGDCCRCYPNADGGQAPRYAARRRRRMGIMSFVGWLFGADAPAPSDATKLDGTTEARLARSLSALPPAERGWITFAQARILFSAKGAQCAFGESDPDGRTSIESFAAQHVSVINFMPVEERVYFVRVQPL